MTGRMSTPVPSYIPGGMNTTRCDRFPTMLLFLHSRTEVLLCYNSGLMEEDCQQCHCCLQTTVTKNMVFVPLSIVDSLSYWLGFVLATCAAL